MKLSLASGQISNGALFKKLKITSNVEIMKFNVLRFLSAALFIKSTNICRLLFRKST